MYCVRKVTSDLYWVGANDRRLAMFEGVYSVPDGVSYNSYLLMDDSTVLFDTVDPAVGKVFFENLEYVLAGRELNYIVVQHMEPDHSGTLGELLLRHPETVIVCNERTRNMLVQFRGGDVPANHFWIVKEGDTLSSGHHEFTFLSAPMVHWPEVMVTYDTTTKTLFSADAFGTFGALNGALFADEVDFFRDYLDEARRYYCNIVGKYGTQVQALLKKMAAQQIEMICPLHGFVWRKNIGEYMDKYARWSTYTPEEQGVMIAYASVYGNTENAAEQVAIRLRERGVKTVMFDVSVTPASDIIAASFRFSHLVFASATYNAGIFVTMEALLHDLAAHNLQNRTVALIENGSWASTSGNLMKGILSGLKNMTILDTRVTLASALKPEQGEELDRLVDALCESLPGASAGGNAGTDGTVQTAGGSTGTAAANPIDNTALFSLSYGLYVLSARVGEKDNGCIINTALQVTDMPKQISVTVNKQNYTHDMILRTGRFDLSVLSQDADFKVFQQFGFRSGRDTADKFDGTKTEARTENGIRYVPEVSNAVISGKVLQTVDCGTHTMFIAEVTEARKLSQTPSVTYTYYFEHIKPKPPVAEQEKKGFVCKICGYVYEGEELPPDFICPLCKHGAEDFEPLK